MDTLYIIVKGAHNILRWVVLILAILAVVRAYLGWFGKRPWTERDRKTGVFFAASVDTQILLGLLLYFFLSPITRLAFQNFAAAMSNPQLRFFALEHVFYMIIAVVFVHLGSILARRVADPVAKHQRAAICYTLAILLILIAIPWSRPLFPGLGGV